MRTWIPGILRSNPAVLFLCVATALLTTGQGIAVPIVPLYADALGVSVAGVGLVVSAFGLARFLTNMPSAVLSDRFGRRLLLVGGPLVAAVGNVLSGLATDLTSLLAYRFVAGIGSAAFITGSVIFIGDISSPANRGRLMSVYQGSFLLGITLGPALGGAIAEVGGLRAPFLAVGAVSLLSGLWAFLRVPESRRPSPTAGRPPEGTLSRLSEAARPVPPRGEGASYGFLLSRDFVLVSSTFAGTFFARGGALFTLVPLIAVREHGLSEVGIGGLFTLSTFVTFLLLPFVGVLSDRYGRKWLLGPGVLLFAVALPVLALSTTVALFAVGMVVYGIAQGLEGPAPLAYVADISPSERQAVAQGSARSIGDLALLIAPPLMGLAADRAGTALPLIANAVGMALIGVLFLAFASEPSRRRTGAVRG